MESSVCWWYLEADHGEEGPHHWVKVVESVGFTQCILRLCEVTQLQREGRTKSSGEGTLESKTIGNQLSDLSMHTPVEC